MQVIGADIGGTHILAAALEADTHGVRVDRLAEKMDVDCHDQAPAILDRWAAALAQVMSGETRAIGIAMPGPFDYPRGISLMRNVAKYEQLYGINVRRELQARLGRSEIPILFENDCNAFVQGEHIAGDGAEFRRFIGITLGTGLGSGFFADGCIQHDGAGVPEEASLGFVPYRKGTAEDYISTRGLLKIYEELGGASEKTIKDVADDARNGDDMARSLFTELGTMIAEVLRPWMVTFEAEALIVAGAIAQSFDLFEAPLKSGLEDFAVHNSQIPDTAAILGVASLAATGVPRS